MSIDDHSGRQNNTGAREIIFAPNIATQQKVYDNLHEFMMQSNEVNEENGKDGHCFQSIFRHNDLPPMPCCPSSDKHDECSKKYHSMPQDTTAYLDEESISSNEGHSLLNSTGDSIELLMSSDCSLYAVIRALDHPFNSYTFNNSRWSFLCSWAGRTLPCAFLGKRCSSI